MAHEAAPLGIPILTPKTLREPEAAAAMQIRRADAAVVVAYGLISAAGNSGYLFARLLQRPRLAVAALARRPRSTAPSWRVTTRPACR